MGFLHTKLLTLISLSAILVVFSQYFTIFATVKRDMMMMLMIMILAIVIVITIL